MFFIGKFRVRLGSSTRVMPLLGLGFALLLFFQSCSSGVMFLPSSKMSAVESGGNGSGYGGKPDGEYYRFIPDYSCEGRQTYKAKILFSAGSITYHENSVQRCDTVQGALRPGDVVRSSLQNDVVAYRSVIYERHERSPVTIPNNLVEVWCRELEANKAGEFEVISYFDEGLGRAVARSYFVSGGVRVGGQDFVVSRLVSNNLVKINESRFQLTIDRRQFSSIPGEFVGQYSGSLEGQQVGRKLSCILGGALDPQVWPVAKIFDQNLGPSERVLVSPDQKLFAFRSPLTPQAPDTLDPVGPRGLYYGRTNPIRGYPSPVLPPAAGGQLTYGVLIDGFKFSSSSNRIYHISELQSDHPNLRLWEFSTETSVNLGVSFSVPELSRSVRSDFKETEDGRYLIYRDSYDKDLRGFHTTLLRSWDRLEQKLTVLNEKIPSQSGDYIHAFQISSSAQKVVHFLQGATDAVLKSVSFDGSNSTVVSPILPKDRYWIFESLLVPNDTGDYAYLWSASTLSGRPLNLHSINIHSGESWLIGESLLVVGGLRNSEAVLVRNPFLSTYYLASSSQRRLTQVSSRSWAFSEQKQMFWAEEIIGDSGKKIFVLDSDRGLENEICPEVVFKKGPLVFGKPPSMSLYLLSHSPGQNHMSAYEVDSNSLRCREVNRIPFTGASIRAAKLAPDNSALIILADGLFQADDLIYIPTQGRPSILFSSPLNPKASISQFEFLSDSRSIIYLGDQEAPGQFELYRWHAPD